MDDTSQIKIVDDYTKKADKLIAQMEEVVLQAQKKVDDRKYNQLLGKLAQYS